MGAVVWCVHQRFGCGLAGYLFSYYHTKLADERKNRIERLNEQVLAITVLKEDWVLLMLKEFCQTNS